MGLGEALSQVVGKVARRTRDGSVQDDAAELTPCSLFHSGTHEILHEDLQAFRVIGSVPREVIPVILQPLDFALPLYGMLLF